MSTPASPRSSGNPTRQQLDDLDALLQRMLDLPVNQLDDEPAPDEPPPPRREPPKARTRSVESPAPAHSTRPAAERPAPLKGPSPSAPSAPVLTPRSAAVREPSPPVAAPPKPATTAAKQGGTTSAPTPAAPPPARATVSAGPPAPWLKPLAALDQVMVQGAGYLGAPGRWLRRPGSRALLGVAGLLLLGLASAILVLDWFGWTW